ncbi:MAG: nucleotidyltransferase domain-containing protein [Deltaproteobacteria bacterium]|jgi:predicted nucleotidyltransferase|nr:nucleotidyltransferase domain-containing protein [Deltaproteobacteria bacterium]
MKKECRDVNNRRNQKDCRANFPTTRCGTLWQFGSYARGDSRPDSDIDLLIVDKGKIQDYFQLSGLYLDLADALKLELDIVIKEDLWNEFV